MLSIGRSRYVIVFYVVITGLSVFAYRHFTWLREDLKFWIPQLYLMILIVVTTLYVLYTADLVAETKQLQQRPLIQVCFREIADLIPLRFDKSFAYGQGLSDEMGRVLGGQQLPPQSNYIVVELKNIGLTTVRNFTATIKFTAPKGSLIEEKAFSSEIERDKTVQIAVTPFSVPWLIVEIQGVVYSDGLRNYGDILGSRVFNPSVPQKDAEAPVRQA